MNRKILIISSNFTGHGHKSITEALNDHFVNFPDVKVHVIDGFKLGGNFGLKIGKLYGSLTRNAKEVWKLVWEISSSKPQLVDELVEVVIKDNFLRLLKSVKPDIILSVHPNFNGPVTSILKEFNIQIPFVTLIADPVSISPLWANKGADYIICPTIESKYKCLEFGIPESKLVVTGFPIRKRFIDHIEKEDKDNSYNSNRPLECLIMSGGEGVGNMSRIARILLKNFNCRIKIIAGRNAILKRRLEQAFAEDFPGRVEVFGFVENVQDLMLSSDIAFTRGSPNTALEAVACNVPLVITGALPGQEEGNPGYIEKYNLGIVCKDLRKLKSLVSELLADNASKLNGIKQSQRKYRDPDISKRIVEFLLDIEKKPKVDYSVIKIGNRFKGLAEIRRTRLTIVKASRSLHEAFGTNYFVKYRELLKNKKIR